MSFSKHVTECDHGAGAGEPDAHGQAALLLAESILHALVDARALTNPEAMVVVDTAAETKLEVATAAGESSERMNESLALLARISASFAADEAHNAVIQPLEAPDRR